MALATYLRLQRERRGISQARLAALAGVSRMTLWRWERATSVPHSFEFDMALAALVVSQEERQYAFALWEDARRTRRPMRQMKSSEKI